MDSDVGLERVDLVGSQCSLNGNTPFPFVFLGWSRVTVTFLDVKNNVLLEPQERSGLGTNPSTILKYVDEVRSTPRVPCVKGVRWVGDTRFDDVVS